MELYPMKWFRFYDEALNDPKVQKLPDAAFKAWVNLLCLANQAKPRGRINRDDIPYSLRLTDERANKMISYFIERELLEEDGKYLVPHNWDSRQFASDNVTERVREHRRNVTRNVPRNVSPKLHGTPPEADTEAEAEEPPLVPPSRGGKARAIDSDWKPDERLLEWAEQKGFSSYVEHETVKFINHFVGEGDTKKDWGAAWRNWMLRAQEYGFKNGASVNGHVPVEKSEEQKQAEWLEYERILGRA